MLLDALEFDLTIADSTESEAGGHEPEAPELPAIAQFFISDCGRAQFGVDSQLEGDEPEDDSLFGIVSQRVPVGRLNHSPPSEDVEDSDFDKNGNSDLEEPLPEVVVPTPAELSRVAIDSRFRSLNSVTLESSERGVV